MFEIKVLELFDSDKFQGSMFIEKNECNNVNYVIKEKSDKTNL
jgi:hypothetical protein